MKHFFLLGSYKECSFTCVTLQLNNNILQNLSDNDKAVLKKH